MWSLVSEWTVEERMAFRREQKLRLDKLLVQQQIEEEALALDGEDGEDIKEHRSEKISTDEVRKLMLHGKKAIVVRDLLYHQLLNTLLLPSGVGRGCSEGDSQRGGGLVRMFYPLASFVALCHCGAASRGNGHRGYFKPAFGRPNLPITPASPSAWRGRGAIGSFGFVRGRPG